MRVWLGACAAALGLLAGCRFHAPAPAPVRQVVPTIGSAAVELPPTNAERIEPDLRTLGKTPLRQASASEEATYRRVTEPDCQMLVAKHSAAANALDAEGGSRCDTPADSLRQAIRFYTALELRNRAAADGLDRFFQLAAVEAGTDLARQALPIFDDLIAKAKAARAAEVRFPLDPADLERQRSQLLSQLEQAEAGAELLNIDLKRRLGLPPTSEDLWPGGAFEIDTTAADPDLAVNAALADRPELRGLRAVYAGLSADTLPAVRELLVAPAVPAPRGLALLVLKKRGPDAETLAEVERRRRQLAEYIAARERMVADEARAAVVALNSQTRRVQLARDRLDGWAARRADAKRQREANQPGAELLEAQATLEWLKARAEAVNEVMAWHQARVRLKAAQGWLAWECLGATPLAALP